MANGRAALPWLPELRMERDANYTAVGAFVILITVMAGLFIYWYSGSREHRHYTRYEIYFQGSVSGLTVGGQVRYLGVDVGRVVRIRVDPRAADRVQVIADIDSDAPISPRTLAELSLQGVTGLLFVDLQQSKPGSDAMPPVASERYPVINSVRSDFDVLLETLPDLAGRTSELMVRLQGVFSAQNTADFTQTLANVRASTDHLPQTMDGIAALVTELHAAVTETRGFVQNLQGAANVMGPDLAKAAERLRETAGNVAAATARLDQMAAENRGDLRAFARDSLPQLEQTIREVRGTADDVRTLSRQLAEDPSRLLYQPKNRGVEIPR
jgi:phospholipid/cholesterol/gamma-HCH transport system substrate-binding protein